MDTVKRIHLMREIADNMAEREKNWNIVDFILRQYGLPTIPTWNGEKVDYILNMLENAEEDILIQIARHYGIEGYDESGAYTRTTIPIIEEENHLWKNGWFRLFISHSSNHKVLAEKIKKSLERYYISAFVAHSDIEATKEWQNEIELALNTTHALTAMLTDDFHQSKWTDQEIGFVMGRGALIVPVHLGVAPYGFIGKFQGLQGQNRTETQIANDIFDILAKNKVSAPCIAKALILKFEKSESFQEAKDNMTLLEKFLNYSDDKIIERIGAVILNNGQVRDAFGVKIRIDQLINKLKKNTMLNM